MTRLSPRVLDARRGVADAKRQGMGRAGISAGPLRGAGVPVLMIQTPSDHASGTNIRTVPWASKFMVDLYWRIRSLKVSPDVKREALAESWEMKQAGPKVEALIMAGRMMG